MGELGGRQALDNAIVELERASLATTVSLRLRAGLLQLSLSAAIAALVFIPTYFTWYPGVLYENAGGRDLVLLIVSVDLTLGPLITTITDILTIFSYFTLATLLLLH